MTEIKYSIQINAPVNKVFEYASDFQKWTEWYEGVSEFRSITETSSGNGTKYIYKAYLFGMWITLGTAITQFRENEGWIGKSFKGFEHKTLWIFEESNGNTKFTHGLIYVVPWYMGGNFSDNRFVKHAWIKNVKNSLQNLKRIMEEMDSG